MDTDNSTVIMQGGGWVEVEVEVGKKGRNGDGKNVNKLKKIITMV